MRKEPTLTVNAGETFLREHIGFRSPWGTRIAFYWYGLTCRARSFVIHYRGMTVKGWIIGAADYVTRIS